MNSHEVLREAVEGIGVKALAGRLRLSSALVYKWCESSNAKDPDASGARNPLDRVQEIVDATGSTEVVNWLCNKAGGFYVKNPTVSESESDMELLQTTQVLVKQFGDMLLAVSKSLADDGKIDGNEAQRIRRTWEKLKGTAEAFVVAAEQGVYHEDS